MVKILNLLECVLIFISFQNSFVHLIFFSVVVWFSNSVTAKIEVDSTSPGNGFGKQPPAGPCQPTLDKEKELFEDVRRARTINDSEAAQLKSQFTDLRVSAQKTGCDNEKVKYGETQFHRRILEKTKKSKPAGPPGPRRSFYYGSGRLRHHYQLPHERRSYFSFY